MGIGIEGTPFYIPDPRKKDEVLDAVYMHGLLLSMGIPIVLREVPRAAARAASHRIAAAGASRAAMWRLGMAEIGGWPTLGRGVQAVAASVPLVPLMLAVHVLATPLVAAHVLTSPAPTVAHRSEPGQTSWWRAVGQAMTGTGVGVGSGIQF